MKLNSRTRKAFEKIERTIKRLGDGWQLSQRELARLMQCDYRTVGKYLKSTAQDSTKKPSSGHNQDRVKHGRSPANDQLRPEANVDEGFDICRLLPGKRPNDTRDAPAVIHEVNPMPLLNKIIAICGEAERR